MQFKKIKNYVYRTIIIPRSQYNSTERGLHTGNTGILCGNKPTTLQSVLPKISITDKYATLHLLAKRLIPTCSNQKLKTPPNLETGNFTNNLFPEHSFSEQSSETLQTES